MITAQVWLWGRCIGAVSADGPDQVARFQYLPEFVGSGIELSPLTMPLSHRVYQFRQLDWASFHGLPGLLADSLPDKFGHALIDQWLAQQGRTAAEFGPIERLCYVGRRGMGALEFRPVRGPRQRKARPVAMDALVELASAILQKRQQLRESFGSTGRLQALNEILRVGTSAGGARAKAIIAWNPDTQEVRSGQIEAGDGFSHWLLKFDGVRNNADKELADPSGYGAVEYAYSLMATEAGIQMSECRLLEENGRRHFMTRRFDRDEQGRKLHMQTLGGLAHFDFNLAGAYSYDQAMQVIQQLELPMSAREEQFRRMCFNVLARNQDDHVKNIAFLMDRGGRWSLSPAYDLTYSYNPNGAWTAQHQMSLNGRRDNFRWADLQAVARHAGLARGRDRQILDQVRSAVDDWPSFASNAGVPENWAQTIGRQHRKISVAH